MPRTDVATFVLNDSLYFSDRMDWATPQYLFNALNKEFDFTLDACAREDNAKCEAYFDETQDGLSRTWSGRVWMNPPYGRGIAAWVAKARAEVESRNADMVVCLVPVRSDAK
jgi:phage N-6-adenine-methyltransferase